MSTLTPADEIRRLTAEALLKADRHRSEAIRATEGLPVYEDLGGILVLLPEGTIVSFDPETRKVGPVDERWKLMAMKRAATTHPSLAALLPKRPDDATTCTACGGSGRVVHGLVCGKCMSLGWTRQPSHDG